MKAFTTARVSLPLGKQTYLAGILNLTPDSFSDGGEWVEFRDARARFFQMLEEGATLIDVGGESTRPGHDPVSADTEIRRVVPFIESIRRESNALISIDTSKSVVARQALNAGADIVNDVWGFQRDPMMAETVAEAGAACVLMHNGTAPATGGGDVVDRIRKFWEESLARAVRAGIRDESILLDPGVGFGKTQDENWAVLRRLKELRAFGFPLFLGVSRKSMLGRLLNRANPSDRLDATLATTVLAIAAGVDFIRVHDVRPNHDCLRVADHCLRYE